MNDSQELPIQVTSLLDLMIYEKFENPGISATAYNFLVMVVDFMENTPQLRDGGEIIIEVDRKIPVIGPRSRLRTNWLGHLTVTVTVGSTTIATSAPHQTTYNETSDTMAAFGDVEGAVLKFQPDGAAKLKQYIDDAVELYRL